MGEAVFELAPKPGQAWFSQYGKHFQEKIFQALVSDIRFSAQMIEVMHPDFFEFPGGLTRAPSSRRSSQDALAILFLLTINILRYRDAPCH